MGEGLVRTIMILSVMTEVSSPMISEKGTTGFSEICSKGMGFQFLMIKDPASKIKKKKKNNVNPK